MDPWLEHKQRLLSRRRCPHCAEPASARRILQGLPCGKCGAPLEVPGTEDRAAEVLAAIRAGWKTSRYAVYVAVLLATFLSGWVPLLASIVTAGAMITANLTLLRRPLRWLSPVQRAITRLGSRLWFVMLLLTSMVLNTLAAPLIAAWGLGAAASGLIGAVSTYLYVEGSLWLIERAVTRAATGNEA
ncbi:MAG: hypothetical protein AAGA48_37305 [Myxococcota bacterium]